ncbi:MAG: DNA-binding response regulator [Thermodesulfobacteriota bacterium]|nr:MAG: DNA-binding response regulator [Thermodesulfobacteriota bacterium]
MRLLIIEDDKKTASFIKKGFKRAGFTVDHVSDGEKALNLLLSEAYDAAVLDIMLPKLDGISVVKETRKLGVHTPVIILSAKHSADDRIRGLNCGGDDYLVKPFLFSELLARVHALTRRKNYTIQDMKLNVGDLQLDFSTREVFRSGKKIELRTKEFELLEYFMRNEGIVLMKTMILEHLWGYNFEPQTNVVEVLVCNLRNKIEHKGEKKIINTIRGVGYVLKVS